MRALLKFSSAAALLVAFAPAAPGAVISAQQEFPNNVADDAGVTIVASSGIAGGNGDPNRARDGNVSTAGESDFLFGSSPTPHTLTITFPAAQNLTQLGALINYFDRFSTQVSFATSPDLSTAFQPVGSDSSFDPAPGDLFGSPNFPVGGGTNDDGYRLAEITGTFNNVRRVQYTFTPAGTGASGDPRVGDVIASVPEPAALGLLAPAGAALLARRKRASGRNPG